MIDLQTLLSTADAYKAATGLTADTTVSHRVFGDTKKLGALREGGDITVGRFNQALAWFAANWPAEASRPAALAGMPISEKGAA